MLVDGLLPSKSDLAGRNRKFILRDPKRIDKVLNVIRLVWSECPDLRLIQLILNSLHKSDQIVVSSDSVLNIEDEALMKAIASYGLEFVKDETEDKLLFESGMIDDLVEELRIAIADNKTYRVLDSDDWKETLEEI